MLLQRGCLIVLTLFCLSRFGFGLPCKAQGVPTKLYEFHHENVLGTSLELLIESSDDLQAKRAEAAALARIDQLSEVFSTYSSTSQLSRLISLPSGESMQADPLLCRVLKHSQEWNRVSQGAFDPRVELLSRVWKQSVERGFAPSDDSLKQLVGRIGKPQWSVDLSTNTLKRLGSEPFTLNAIAKGTILDAVAESILQTIPDIALASVNIGGDIRVVGRSEQTVSVPHPTKDRLGAAPMLSVKLVNQGIATSGISERTYEIGGVRYSHLIDPRTGQPCQTALSATVIAPDAEIADVLATICCVLKPALALQLIESLPGTAAWIVTTEGQSWVSDRWPDAEESHVEVSPGEETQAATKHEFNIEFEIAKSTQGGRYRRPYVAVWVEDKDGFPVKTLSLFLMTENPGPRWHRDLRRWYSSDQARLLADDLKLIGTVSKPTRNPGNYKVAWDGTDDHGKLLPDGSYTLYIEAAREHGSYQLMKHPFDIGKSDFDVKLKANSEIGAASIKYHKK
jgi:thiamine biosynthesis lipoprotein ApbE